MRILLTTFLIIFMNAQCTYGQTKLISHKSHSGKASDFHKAMTHFNYDLDVSNFGVAPEPLVRHARLDTLRYVSDSVAIMTTSNYCVDSDVRVIDSIGFLWNEGVDTLYNHPLFSKKKSLHRIKQELKENYFFENPVDSIVFIGYDPEKKVSKDTKKKKNSAPFAYYDETKPPLPPLKIIGLSIILLVSLIIGFIYQNNNSRKKLYEKD